MYVTSKAQNQVISSFLNDKDVIHSPIGISVCNIETGEKTIDYNSKLMLTPASVQKLITSATALEVLGAEFSFKTHIATNGYIKDKILYGDLIIIGGGDPSLGSEYFNSTSDQYSFLDEWCIKLRLKGIDSIAGGVITDNSIFSDQNIPGSWTWEDIGNYYGAPAKGITFSDNMARITFQSDSLPDFPTTITQIKPDHSELSFINLVKSSSDPRDLAYLYGEPDASFRSIVGTIPIGKKAFSIKSSLPNPEKVLKSHLLEKMNAYNIKIGKLNNFNLFSIGYPHKPADTLVINSSPPLREIIRQLNFESINLYAEHLVKYLGLIQYGEGSTKAGIKAIEVFWKNKGIDLNQIHLADGSGLSRKNTISADVLTQVLTFMKLNGKDFEDFRKSIPRVGLEGTQKYYFQESELTGKFRAKSGSMTRVRSFSGYMYTQKGTPLAFAVIINNFPCGSFTMAAKLENLLEEIYFTY